MALYSPFFCHLHQFSPLLSLGSRILSKAVVNGRYLAGLLIWNSLVKSKGFATAHNVLSFHRFPHESATFITKCTKLCVPRFTTYFWYGAKIRWIGLFWRIWCFHMTRCFHMHAWRLISTFFRSITHGHTWEGIVSLSGFQKKVH